jgi:hypothetical protein
MDNLYHLGKFELSYEQEGFEDMNVIFSDRLSLPQRLFLNLKTSKLS